LTIRNFVAGGVTGHYRIKIVFRGSEWAEFCDAGEEILGPPAKRNLTCLVLKRFLPNIYFAHCPTLEPNPVMVKEPQKPYCVERVTFW
jgi:hypothetical protein